MKSAFGVLRIVNGRVTTLILRALVVAALLLLLSPLRALGQNQDLCKVSLAITLDNVVLRGTSPTVDVVAVIKELDQLRLIRHRCLSTKIDWRTNDCELLKSKLGLVTGIPFAGIDLFSELSHCNLPLDKADKAGGVKSAPGTLIQDRLNEMQKAEGEGIYWNAADLYALILVFPQQTISAITNAGPDPENIVRQIGAAALGDELDQVEIDSRCNALEALLPTLNNTEQKLLRDFSVDCANGIGGTTKH